MTSNYQSGSSVLSEIITSAEVGGIHLRRVGELLVAREEMNDWFRSTGAKYLTGDEYAEIAERVLELEERYTETWKACDLAEQGWRNSVCLAQLELALKEAAEYFHGVASRDSQP